ncbi:MAG: M6 family metalloprotease domain-containing protein [Candidatus Electrothrix sp. AR3]|nr:M6 family metalloprotease domain-containing protein [Candidatus Electrothrix sp. AR3]
MPSIGNVKVLVLLLEFNGLPPVEDQATLYNKIFGPEDTSNWLYPWESLSAFYDRSSYGKLQLTGYVAPWFNGGNRLPDPGTYGSRASYRESLIKNAINNLENAEHDFTQYDSDGDGYIDYIAVLWTGTNNDALWNAYYTSFNDDTYSVDGMKLPGYSWQWAASFYDPPNGQQDLVALIHETGHALGLPDYYDKGGSGPDGGLGRLDVMDGKMGDHNAFSKFVLDWLDPTVISTEGSHPDQILAPSVASGVTVPPQALLIMPNATGAEFEEYFMVEYIKREQNAKEYPGEGLLIWHVNAVLDSGGYNYEYNNYSSTEYKLLRLMEADGQEEIETGDGLADAEDFW